MGTFESGFLLFERPGIVNSLLMEFLCDVLGIWRRMVFYFDGGVSVVGKGSVFFTTIEPSSCNGRLFPHSLYFGKYFKIHLLLLDDFLRRFFEKIDSVFHFELGISQSFFHLGKKEDTLRR